MKHNMIDDIEKLFNGSNYSFVTVIANGKALGNYCTKSYQDMERLYNDMNRHDLTINDICLKKIEKDETLDEKALSEKIEKLSKELGDAHSRYHSALVAKQAADYERYQITQKKEALEDFVDIFNGTHDEDQMKLHRIYQTKWVLCYTHKGTYRLKKSISFYDDLDLDAIRNSITLYQQLPEALEERFFIENDALIMTELGYTITIKPSSDSDYATIIFQTDDEEYTETTTVAKENLFDAVSKYVRN